MALSLGITILLAQMLEPAALGILMTAEAFIEIFNFFFYFGFNNAILRMASTDPDGFDQGLNKAIGNAFVIKTVMILPLFAIILAIAKFSFQNEEIFELAFIYMFIYMLESFAGLFGIARRALGQFKLISGIQVINKLLRIATIFLVLSYWGTVKALVYAFLIEKLIRLIISAATTLRFIKPRIERSQLKEMFKNCIGYAFADPLQGIQNKIDRLMLNSLIGPVAVAMYAVPAKFNRAIQIFMKTASSVFNPNLHNSRANDYDYYKEMVSKLFKYSCLIAAVGFIGIYYYAEPTLELFFGEKYIESLNIAKYFAFISAISILENTSELVIISQAAHRLRMFYKTTSIVLNIGLNFFLIPAFGLMGAIYATIVANAVRLLIKVIYTHKYTNFGTMLAFVLIPFTLASFVPIYVLLPIYVIFIAFSGLLRFDDLKYLLDIILKRKSNEKN